MILNDANILACLADESIKIDPFDPNKLQPASYDLTLDVWFKVFDHHLIHRIIDPRDASTFVMDVYHATEDDPFILQPGGFALGSTIEEVVIPANVAGRLEGKSSLARLGLIVHEAGFFDPGFFGNCTLELSNLAPHPLKLYPGMKICQMSFTLLTGVALRPYGSDGLNSKYQGQKGPTESRYHENG